MLQIDTLRVVVIDDHELLRNAIIDLIKTIYPLEICGQATGETDAVQMVRQCQPDLVIVDIALRQGDGINLIKRIRKLGIDVKVLVVSMYDERLFSKRALQAGASGYVHKQAPAQAVLDAIHAVLAGHVYTESPETPRPNRSELTGTDSSSLTDRLTDRELQVFLLIGNGLKNAEIGKQLSISTRTVESFREKLKSKLDLKSSAELNRYAVEFAMQRGNTEDDEN